MRHEVLTLSYCHVAGEYPLNLALLPELCARAWARMADQEPQEDYVMGGYHPVTLGDMLGDRWLPAS